MTTRMREQGTVRSGSTGRTPSRVSGAHGSLRHFAGFTLIEILVVVAIIGLLIAILLPSLAKARDQARVPVCLSNLKSMGLMTQLYLNNNKEYYPIRSATTSTGGGSVFGAFEPMRIIIKSDRRPLEIFACPTDADPLRTYALGDDTGTYPDSLGIGTFFKLPADYTIQYSYGLNNMTGLKPTTEAERRIFNANAAAYKIVDKTLLYADCAWVNARGHDKAVNDAPKLKGRVANAGANQRMDKLAEIPDELGQPVDKYKRHPAGNNVLFMDHHGESVSQKALFAPATVLYSWTEEWNPTLTEPPTTP